MKLNPFGNLILIAVTVSLAATGCKKNPQSVTPLPPEKSYVGDNGPGPGVSPVDNQNPTGEPVKPTEMGDIRDWKDAHRNPDIFKANTIYFDYDSSVLRAGEKSKLDAIADHLKGNLNTAVEVDGNCDERGTDQYNYSLGERRALAARESLIAMGVDGKRVFTVSYGRSRPADTGHSDASHAKNRRDEFVLLSK